MVAVLPVSRIQFAQEAFFWLNEEHMFWAEGTKKKIVQARAE